MSEMSSKLSDVERELLERITEKTNRITEVLAKVMPEADRALISTVASGLGDFWEIAENHRLRVEEMLRLEGPKDRARLAELLSDLFYGDVKAHLPNHVESMEEVLPALIEILDSGDKDKKV